MITVVSYFVSVMTILVSKLHLLVTAQISRNVGACIRPRLDLTRGKRQVRGDIWVTPHNTCKAQTRTGSGPHLKSVENVVVPAEL